jgi:undecaprenyl-diphosphatase
LIQELDIRLLFAWQSVWEGVGVDALFIALRDKATWYPAYAAIIGFLIWKFKSRSVFYIVGALLAVGLSDLISSHFLKELFGRPRPCQVAELADSLRVLVHCSPHFSLPSSHASNHFALSAFLVFSGAFPVKPIRYLLWFWALAVGLAQVYVGVHYPTDIIAGAAFGILLGWLIAGLTGKSHSLLYP